MIDPHTAITRESSFLNGGDSRSSCYDSTAFANYQIYLNKYLTFKIVYEMVKVLVLLSFACQSCNGWILEE